MQSKSNENLSCFFMCLEKCLLKKLSFLCATKFHTKASDALEITNKDISIDSLNKISLAKIKKCVSLKISSKIKMFCFWKAFSSCLSRYLVTPKFFLVNRFPNVLILPFINYPFSSNSQQFFLSTPSKLLPFRILPRQWLCAIFLKSNSLFVWKAHQN